MEGSDNTTIAQPKERRPEPPRWREIVLFLAGLVGVGSEAWTSLSGSDPADPTLIAVYAVMMGLPFVMRKDGR